MRDMFLRIHLLLGLAIATHGHTTPKKMDCPHSCSCEIRPWFTPKSIYIEALTVDCNALDLYSVPDKLPAKTQILLLQANNIEEIKNTDHFPVNLTGLDLSQNNLSLIANINFTNMHQILSVYLEENKLTELMEGSFSGLENLQELYINHNLISVISPKAFAGVSNLLRLHLNSNRLQMINSMWFEAIPNLEILMIGENPIVNIEDMNFKPLINLRSLVLAGVNLTEIPDNAFLGLDKLESISFYDNKFIHVPSVALQKVVNLKFLDLNKNPVRRIQRGDFSNMLHLKELGINNMPELVSIDSLAIENLPELRKIEATNNPKLAYIHPNAFYRLPKLETLMLNSNSLSAIYRSTIEALPNLKEISIHSNPMRCDCVIRWINMNKTSIRFMEPDSLFCFDPPEFQGLNIRQVHFREMMEICLPLIAPQSFPLDLDLNTGSSVSLHCRATAEPEPEIYWITPSGYKLVPNIASGIFYVHPEGTLTIKNVSLAEAGLYTCVAKNLVGADLKTILITVDGSFTGEVNGSLKIIIKEVQSNSVMVSWKSKSKILKSSVQWTAYVKTEYTQIAHSVRMPSDIKQYNLTRLNPLTEYEICIDAPNIYQHIEKQCINVTTKGMDTMMKEREFINSATVIITLCCIFGIIAVAFIFNSTSSYLKHNSDKYTRNSIQIPAFAYSDLYPPLLSLWNADKESTALEVKATVIKVPTNSP
ncbi:leucine-rich repeat neuronal protein 3 precursor [Xenopus tropicalis]|uniref:Leucine rich repeat neuronal 3 n=1 Tax=Xenopus tropicalis TaxID=8364 RepID=Q0D2D1_XENTR|nr:leucine-rich repeat neuronal protein 3 precursor [Xenopus tropicalis]AAI21980.1 leucine rich repeat neuronal 3 [Xenopus tropicalis]|eukprot:NP_001072526.1 leucine-rich repeat neuronal protein 3 precursor [Xenopus tropicalis]